MKKLTENSKGLAMHTYSLPVINASSYQVLREGLRQAKFEDSSQKFMRKLSKETAMNYMKDLLEKGEYEGHDEIKNKMAADWMGLPKDDFEREIYFENLHKEDIEKYRDEFQSYCRFFDIAETGVNQAMLMGGPAPQEPSKADAEYDAKFKPTFFDKIMRAVENHKKKIAIGLGGVILGTTALFVTSAFLNRGNYQNPDNIKDSDRDGLSDEDETNVYHTDPKKPDTDGDYVSDEKEVKQGSNPLKIDTDGGGIDDFNELYTYESDPSNPADDKAIIEKIPNVEVRHWDPMDGREPLYVMPSDKDIIVSMRDPLVQWFAKRAKIEWESFDQQKVGYLWVNGDSIARSKPNESMPFLQPSYFLTKGKIGNCGEMSTTAATILRLMGHDAILVGGKLGGLSHQWCEAFIDGEVHVVEGSNIIPKVRSGNYVPNEYYNPDWYKK
jgi:hypothetical protein